MAKKKQKTDVAVSELQVDFSAKLSLATTSEAQTHFDVAMYYWDKRNVKQAERWLRYASQEGHQLAQNFLDLGIRLGFFFKASSQLNSFAIEILENFITPQPAEHQIKAVEKLLFKYLNNEYSVQSNG